MFKIRALELAEDPSVYWKEGKKKGHPKAAFALEILFSYLLVFLLCIGSVLVYDSVFPIESPMNMLFLCIGIVEMLLFFIYLFPTLRRLAPVFTACGFFVGFLFLREPIILGLKQCANEVIRKFNAHFGAEILVFQEVEESAVKQTAVYFMVLLFLWWFVEALFHLKNMLLFVVPPLLVICGELLVGKAPGELPLLMVAGGFLTLLSYGNISYGDSSYGAGRHIKAGGAIAGIRSKAVLFLAVMIVASLFLTDRYCREKAEELVKLQDKVLSYQFALESQFVEYMPRMMLGQSPGRVSNKEPKYDGKEELLVTTNRLPAGNVYLRGYVGDTYRNGNWTNRSQMEFEEVVSKQLAYANQVAAGGYVLNLFYKSQLTALVDYRSKYQIQYLDNKEDYAYLPYMTDLEHASKDGRTVTPLLLDADAMIYREGADSLYVEVLSPYDLFREVKKGADYTGNKVIENCYNGYLSQYLRVPTRLQKIRELGGKLRQEFLLNYRSTVKTDGLGTESLAATKEIYAAHLVREELFRRASYSLLLDKLPFGEDVVEYFLFGSGKGFCQHYASAGVLLLRQMGIPARYVSGYVIEPKEFVRTVSEGDHTGVEYLATVKDSAAHAWVEVFIEHIGWVPVEMTEGSVYAAAGGETYNAEFYENLWQDGSDIQYNSGGYENDIDVMKDIEEMSGSVQENAEEVKGMEGGQEVLPETEPAMEQKAQTEPAHEGSRQEDNAFDADAETLKNQKEDAENRNGEGKIWQQGTPKIHRKGNVVLLCGSVVCIGAGGLLVFVILVVRHRKKTDYKQESARKRIERLVSDINRQLWRKGILKTRGLDDRGYREVLNKNLVMIPAEELQEYFLVLEKMAYSNEPPTEEDVRCCYRTYRKIREVSKLSVE